MSPTIEVGGDSDCFGATIPNNIDVMEESVHSLNELSILEGESGRVAEEISLETIDESSPSSDPDPASLSRFYPRWRGKPVYHGNAEALGWALDSVGRAVYYVGMGAFLGTTILQQAKLAAGCVADEVCEKTMYGMRPSSLLTTYTMCVGIASASM